MPEEIQNFVSCSVTKAEIDEITRNKIEASLNDAVNKRLKDTGEGDRILKQAVKAVTNSILFGK